MTSKQIHELNENNNVKKKHMGQKYKRDYQETSHPRKETNTHTAPCVTPIFPSSMEEGLIAEIHRKKHSSRFFKSCKGQQQYEGFFVELLLCNVIAQMNLSLNSAPVIVDEIDEPLLQDCTRYDFGVLF